MDALIVIVGIFILAWLRGVISNKELPKNNSNRNTQKTSSPDKNRIDLPASVRSDWSEEPITHTPNDSRRQCAVIESTASEHTVNTTARGNSNTRRESQAYTPGTSTRRNTIHFPVCSDLSEEPITHTPNDSRRQCAVIESTASEHTVNTTTRGNSNTQRESLTYTPRTSSRSSSSIAFKPTTTKKNAKSSVNGDALSNILTSSDLDGLHDAFTGAPLKKASGLYQCQSCKVYYHAESFQLLRKENASRCVACHSTDITAIVADTKTPRGKDYTPKIITLQNYQQHAGSVVTFEGFVHKVLRSKRGSDFAAMFENKSWSRGFKLVFFDRSAKRVGGEKYINSLAGKKIKVRGLIKKNPIFGYEIIVSEKSMILSVK